jgi:hypothetical protein
VVKVVDEETLDVRSIVILSQAKGGGSGGDEDLSDSPSGGMATGKEAHLVGHDHEAAVAELFAVRVDLAVLEAHDLADVLNLSVAGELGGRRLADVEKLSTEREDTVLVPADDVKAGDGERLGRVSLGQDERAFLALWPARPVGVGQLEDAGNPAE